MTKPDKTTIILLVSIASIMILMTAAAIVIPEAIEEYKNYLVNTNYGTDLWGYGNRSEIGDAGGTIGYIGSKTITGRDETQVFDVYIASVYNQNVSSDCQIIISVLSEDFDVIMDCPALIDLQNSGYTAKDFSYEEFKKIPKWQRPYSIKELPFHFTLTLKPRGTLETGKESRIYLATNNYSQDYLESLPEDQQQIYLTRLIQNPIDIIYYCDGEKIYWGEDAVNQLHTREISDMNEG